MVAWLFGVLAFGGLAIHLWINHDSWGNGRSSIIFAKFLLILLIPFSLMMLSACYKMSKADRDWDISINSSKFIWIAPTNVFNEKSFNFDLLEIEKVVCKYKHSSVYDFYYFNGFFYDFQYFVHLKSGLKFPLSNKSGVYIRGVFEALQKNGVIYEDIKT